MATVNEKMTALADEIRILSGTEDTMGLDAMKNNVNTANSAVSAALTALTEKGVEVPDGTIVSGLAELIGMIEAGGDFEVVAGTYNSAEDIIVSSNTYFEIGEYGKSKYPIAVVCYTNDTIASGLKLSVSMGVSDLASYYTVTIWCSATYPKNEKYDTVVKKAEQCTARSYLKKVYVLGNNNYIIGASQNIKWYAIFNR